MLYCPDISGQSSLSMDLPKPQKFENRKLGYEKTEEKKFKLPRKFIQNTVTHYNFYFNAETKLMEIVERAKSEHRDDYRKLLPFYNYTLEATSRFKNDLDSVIYKSTAGILLHDLRNSWVDNLYMLIGQAYFYRNSLDSAYMTFQYVNYAFSPKEKDGYDIVIGSNANRNEDGTAKEFSVSTDEKRNLPKRALSLPPSRNESLIWQIKTYLANNQLSEASGLIETLKIDPLFPDRLETELDEVQAHWFYKINQYDSAAHYLEKALDNAETKHELARWEYLVAQLYDRAKNTELAKQYYEQSIKHTLDPVLEVYARLYSIQQKPEGQEEAIKIAVEELMKMAKKDKYITYRDVIYYTAAQAELKRDSLNSAKNFLLKSIRYSMNNPEQKSQSFLALANVSFDSRQYVDAYHYYDSVALNMVDSADLPNFMLRKNTLQKIATQKAVVARQDSLQRIAGMTEKARETYIKKIVKQLRKQRGLKDDDGSGSSNNTVFFSKNNNAADADMFAAQAKGDFYFYNTSLKARGFTEFKTKWGSRPNVDNWRRLAAINNTTYNKQTEGPGSLTSATADTAVVDMSYEGLLANVPLTDDKIKISNDSIDHALFQVGLNIQNGLEEYAAAIETYENLLERYPATPHREEALFNLYYCYQKTGNAAKMAATRQMMQTQFADGKYLAILDRKVKKDEPEVKIMVEATKTYDDVYNLFIEGKFDQALLMKRQADNLYGESLWTPQLLYIEAVYYIRQRQDTLAKQVLQKIIQKYPSSPITKKTQNLLSVLNRRKEIEDYLTNLDIQRPAEDSMIVVNNNPVPGSTVVPKTDSLVAKTDSLLVKNQSAKKPEPIAKPKVDSSALVKTVKPVAVNSIYSNTPDQKQYVGLVLDKVDPVYANEAKNAFNRYHREKYYNKTIDIVAVPISDTLKIILFKDFANAADAIDYIDRTKKLAPVEIIPWLTESKYTFILITEKNLGILTDKKDISTYRKFLHDAYPGKF